MSDPVWESVPSFSLEKKILGTPSSSADLSGSFKVLWDSENLYVLITVTDDTIGNTDTTSYLNDNVEIFIDGDNAKGITYDSNDVQYRFVRGATTIIATPPDGKTVDVDAVQKELTGGYSAEFSLPLATIGGAISENSLIGFDVHCADNDGAGRKSKLAWASDNDNGWGNPSVFGTLKLKAVDVTGLKTAGLCGRLANKTGVMYCAGKSNHASIIVNASVGGNGAVSLFDCSGRRFSAKHLQRSVFNAGSLNPGTYIAVYTESNGIALRNRVVVY
jgi:hypothetical protein